MVVFQFSMLFFFFNDFFWDFLECFLEKNVGCVFGRKKGLLFKPKDILSQTI